MDGPYAETKERIGSFFIIEAKDPRRGGSPGVDASAAQLNAHLGWGIEVRPIEAFSPTASLAPREA